VAITANPQMTLTVECLSGLMDPIAESGWRSRSPWWNREAAGNGPTV